MLKVVVEVLENDKLMELLWGRTMAECIVFYFVKLTKDQRFENNIF